MKHVLLLATVLAPAFLFTACGDEPRPVVVNHYHTRRVYHERGTVSTPVDESRGNGSAEGFRAVEKPASYSQ